jgi:glycosyltransferase involved in cell wall biosynthesis
VKVSISVPGRFHGFDLARQLQDHGVLHCMVSSYPAFKATRFGIFRHYIKSVPGKEIIVRGWHRIFRRYPNWFWLNEWYDRQASVRLPMNSDVYVLWAGFALHTIKRIRRENPHAKIILERGSAHIMEQDALLGLVGQTTAINPKTLAKELREYEEVDFISVPGKFVASTFVSRGIPAEKIFTNTYGVNLEQFSPSPRPVKSSRTFTAGYVGVVSKQKNVEGIIRSVAMLREKGQAIRLLIAGSLDVDSYPVNYLKQFDFVTYLGNLEQHQLPDVYKQMDVFVLNSIHDGFGMVLLQAMAMEVVPIATVNTGGAEVIQHGLSGFIIPIMDDLELANCIALLIRDPNFRRKAGALARKRVMEGLTWKDYGNRYLEFCSRLA